MPEHFLFLTGHLAEPHLRRVLGELEPLGFDYEVLDIGLSVAGLMTADMIARRVRDPRGADRVMVPGLCAGDLDAVGRRLGVPVVRGPEDLKDLPEFFGRGGRPVDLSRYDVRIFAEIVDAPDLGVEGILERAARYAEDGADVIDLGCLPGRAFEHLEQAVAALKEAGHAVSVDSLESEELLRGGRAGADYLLSLTEASLWIADEVEAVPVLIPQAPGDLESLARACTAMIERGRPFFADPVLDPIHFGFTDSLVRYHALRRRFPDAPIMMGTGNLTELTEADTTGITAVLLGVASELQVSALLTTEVSPHARTVVRECDAARRLMHAARADHSLPKGYSNALTAVHERKPFSYTLEEVRQTAAQVRDPSYRIQLTEEGIHVYNRDGLETGVDPFELFPRLTPLQSDAPHAFYMGVELGRAQIAWQLGRRYAQDEELRWGAASARPPAGERAEGTRRAAGTTLSASQGQARSRRRERAAGASED